MCHLVTLKRIPHHYHHQPCDVTFLMFHKTSFLIPFGAEKCIFSFWNSSIKGQKMSRDTLTNLLPPLCVIWFVTLSRPPPIPLDSSVTYYLNGPLTYFDQLCHIDEYLWFFELPKWFSFTKFKLKWRCQSHWDWWRCIKWWNHYGVYVVNKFELQIARRLFFC